MQNWTKEHARFVGRVIFANFLNLPLEKYQDFIEEVEREIRGRGHGKSILSINVLSKAKICKGKNVSPKVIARIEKIGKGISIRYTHKGFNRVYNFEEESPLFYKLRRISSRNGLTNKILKGIIEHQKKYLITGDPIDLVPFSQVQLPVDNSWASRLVNRLSIIIPSGEEKPLKSFFLTQRDINKRLIKQLFDKENEDLQSGKLKKPLTDNQLREILEREYSLSLSRWTIGHCRKDMGIPSFKRRLSGYKYPPFSVNFSVLYPLTIDSVIKYAPEKSGVYELSVKSLLSLRGIPTIVGTKQSQTTVIYIGSTKSLRKRLREHLGKNSKNGHIGDFLKKYECSFRYIQIPTPHFREKEREVYKLFVATYGSPPKCNKVKP